MERSSGLFEVNSPLFQNSTFTCIDLLLFFVGFWHYLGLRLHETGRKRQRWVRRKVEVMFTLAHRDSAHVGYSMGTNVNTPFFQVPAPEYHHVISFKTSKVCLLLRLFVFRTEASAKRV